MAILVALCALASLAVDLARVQLAKTELQRASDAAARYAVSGLKRGGSFALARQRAQAAAGENLVDGRSLQLDASDIQFIVWDRATGTFKPAVEGALPRANAVRIVARLASARGTGMSLALGQIIGKNTLDLHVTSTAMIRNDHGLVGLESIEMSGNGNTDSYDSDYAPYSSAAAREHGTIVSNGDIAITGNGIVHGDVRLGPGAGFTHSGGGAFTGALQTQSYALRFPAPTAPSACVDLGTVKLSSRTMKLSGGDYLLDRLELSGHAVLEFTGPARLYLRDRFTMSGGTIKTYDNRAANLEINLLTSAPVSLAGQADLYAAIYAPLSDVSQSGQADIYGGIIARTLKFTGSWTGGVHYDESLDWAVGPALLVE